MTQTRGILWDFDGTLAFRSGLWSDLLVETLDIEADGHGHAAAVFRRPMSTGFPWHDWEHPRVPPISAGEWWAQVTRHLERGMLGAGVAPDVAARAARRARSEYLRLDRWHVFPDTIATLDRLAGDGWRHVILSNHVPELADLVAALGFADRFQAILTSAATGYEKPHEQAFALGREALGNPDLVWMVGDNPVADVYGAERLGIPAALVRRPIPDATGRTDLRDLPRILGNSTREPAPRPAARVVLVDETDRVLLVRVVDPINGRTFWATPGGALDPGETFEEAARREIAEETGLTTLVLGPWVWTREHRGTFMGRRFHAVERIFLARVDAFEPSAAGYTALERQVQTEARWWTLDELIASSEEFAPRGLARAFEQLLRNGPPEQPLDVEV